MSDILAVISMALKATFWLCQQDFYHLSDRGYDRDKAPAYQPSIKTSQVDNRASAVSIRYQCLEYRFAVNLTTSRGFVGCGW